MNLWTTCILTSTLPCLVCLSWFLDECYITWHGRLYWERSNLQGQDWHEEKVLLLPHTSHHSWREQDLGLRPKWSVILLFIGQVLKKFCQQGTLQAVWHPKVRNGEPGVCLYKLSETDSCLGHRWHRLMGNYNSPLLVVINPESSWTWVQLLQVENGWGWGEVLPK